MKDKYEAMNLFEQLQAGLEESIAQAKGQLSLKTTILPTPPPKIGGGQIVALRKRLRMSQAYFAATLNVSSKTVQSWEQGTREPGDAALRMLQVVRENPGVVRQILTADGRNGRPVAIKTRGGKANPAKRRRRRRHRAIFIAKAAKS